MSSALEIVQADLYGRLFADPFLSTVGITLVRPRARLGFVQIQSLIDQALAGAIKRNGKAGASIAVLMPSADVVDPNTPGPRLDFLFTARCEEIPEINMGAIGTLKSAETIALHVLSLGHLFAGGRGQVLTGRDINPIAYDDEQPRVGYDVTFLLKGGLEAQAKTATPTIAYAGGNVTLASATSGAALLYSVDGAYPTTPYTAPFVAAPGVLVRAAATSTGRVQSDVRQLLLS